MATRRNDTDKNKMVPAEDYEHAVGDCQIRTRLRGGRMIWSGVNKPIRADLEWSWSAQRCGDTSGRADHSWGDRRAKLQCMRWVIALSTLLLAAGCGEDRSRTAVVPQQITVSADRLTVEAQTAYPTNSGCAKEPGGLSIDVANGVATITAIVENSTGATECTLECGQVWQSVSLDEPLPDPVRFTYPADANPGCGGISPLVTTTNPPPATLPCPRCQLPHAISTHRQYRHRLYKQLALTGQSSAATSSRRWPRWQSVPMQEPSLPTYAAPAGQSPWFCVQQPQRPPPPILRGVGSSSRSAMAWSPRSHSTESSHTKPSGPAEVSHSVGSRGSVRTVWSGLYRSNV